MTTNLDKDIQTAIKKCNMQYRERPDSNLADDDLAHKLITTIAKHYGIQDNQDSKLLKNKDFEAILGTLKGVIISFLLSRMNESDQKDFLEMSSNAKKVMDNPKPKEKWA